MDIRATLKPVPGGGHYTLHVNGAWVAFYGYCTLGQALDLARSYLSGDRPSQVP